LNPSKPHGRASLLVPLVQSVILLLGTLALAESSWSLRALWAPVVALVVIVLTRKAIVGLLIGAFAGAVVASEGDVWAAYISLFADHLAPNLTSPWKTGAIAFTIILGGFAAVLEAGGGFTSLLKKMAPDGDRAGQRVELAAGGLGLLCFFDGLANSMVVGGVSRDLADRAGVARAKLAYIVDSTSSAVACVAVISTWIAFQLSMIAEAYALAGHEVNPYLIFWHSLPFNFHSWFTLMLLFVAIRFQFHPGPMAGYVEAARLNSGELPLPESNGEVGSRRQGKPYSALAPLAVLLSAFFVGFMVFGDPEPGWPQSKARVFAALGSEAGPMVLVIAGLVATAVALLIFPRGASSRVTTSVRAFGRGATTMVGPVGVLVAAWMMGSVMTALGTADLIYNLLNGHAVLWMMPTLTFLTGALISFTTGTSWGTMGLLFPLAVPATAEMGGGESLLLVVVAAVFSGAVFGDHCSPFSDTTIVSSISCGVEPHDHVRSQIPYAFIAATVAVVFGFIPAGFGVSPYLSLALGCGVLFILPRLSFLTPQRTADS